MLVIAKHPTHRLAVSAATWISDRVAGPVAQRVLLDVVVADSIEDRRQAAMARFAELYGEYPPGMGPARRVVACQGPQRCV